MTRARDAACHCGSGRKLKRLLVNHELGRPKSFWVDESLSYMLATTDLDALGRDVRAPFPAFALVFTDRLALSLGERLLSPDTSCNGAGQLLRVTTVYVTEIGADDRRELELCFAFDTAGADPPHLVRHTIALSDDAPVVAHLEGLSPRVVAEPAVADASPRRGLLQLAVNAILYATSAGVTPELRAPPPRPRRAPQRQPAATAPKGATSSSDSWFAVTGVAPRRAATSGCGGLRRTGRGRTWRRSSSARTGCGP